jgi:phage tail sheath gpL-like
METTGDFYMNNKREPNREMKKLLIEEAKWKYNNSNYKQAAELYIQAYKYAKAIEIYGKHSMSNDMVSNYLLNNVFIFIRTIKKVG